MGKQPNLIELVLDDSVALVEAGSSAEEHFLGRGYEPDGEDPDESILNASAKDVIASIAEYEDADAVRELLATEQASKKPRKSVISAAEARIEELEAEADDEAGDEAD